MEFVSFDYFLNIKFEELLHKCNAQKEKGVSVIQIFKYKMVTSQLVNECTCNRILTHVPAYQMVNNS